MNTILNSACSYANLGLAIVPVASCDKHPFLKDWPNAATTDADTIRTWLTDQYPGSNIALVTGLKSGNVIAIDVDMKPDQRIDGMQTVTAWQEEHGAWPETPVSITGSGGRHYLFRVPETIGNCVCAELGVDIRGDRGCVVLPPSVHPNGNVYSWETSPGDCPIADANESVLGFIKYVRGKSGHGEQGTLIAPWERLDHVPEGKRDIELFRACSHWRSLGYDQEKMRTAALAYNEESFDPPLNEQEVIDKVEYVCEKYSSGRHAIRPKRLPSIEPSSLMVNDKDLSRLFGEAHRDCLCFVREENCFYFFDGRRWRRDLGGVETSLLCKAFIDALMDMKSEVENDSERQDYLRKLANYEKQNCRERLIKDAKSELAVYFKRFDKDPMLLNVLNGTIDLRTGRFREHRASDMLTMCAPVHYDESARPELWENTIASIFDGDLDTMQSFQVALGRALMCDTSREQFFVAGFVPRSGKSLVFGEITSLLGADEDGYACVVPPDTFEQSRNKTSGQSAREDLMSMRKARVIVANEPKKGMILDCALIKMLTGNDMITARRLYKGLETFSCIGTIFIVTNHMPQILDETIYESGRMVVAPFNHHVPEDQQDKMLKKKLRKPEQLSGVLNWLLEGVRMAREGLEVEPSMAMIKSLDAVIEANDVIGRFIREALIEAPELRLRGSSIHNVYRRWCMAQGLDALKSTLFYEELKKRGIEIRRTNDDQHAIFGYRLSDSYNHCDKSDSAL